MPRKAARAPEESTLAPWAWAWLTAGSEFWGRVLEITTRYGMESASDVFSRPKAPDARPVRRPRVGNFLTELALVPWLAAERFGREVGRPRGLSPGRRSQLVADTLLPLPFVVRNAMQGVAVYRVARRRVQAELVARRLPFRALDLGHGATALVVSGIHNGLTPLGPYDEVIVGCFVTPRHRPSPAGLLVVDFPVSTARAAEAGRTVWGYPKTHEDVGFTSARHAAIWSVRRQARRSPLLTLTFPRGGGGVTSAIPWHTYTVHPLPNGGPHVTMMTRTGEGERIRRHDAEVVLRLGDRAGNRGDATFRLLRGLDVAGAPPMLALWTDHMTAEFSAPRALK